MWNKFLTVVLLVLVLITSAFLGYSYAGKQKEQSPVTNESKDEELKEDTKEEEMITDNGTTMLTAELENAEAVMSFVSTPGSALQTLIDSDDYDNSMFNVFEVLPDAPRVRKPTNTISRIGNRVVFVNHPDDNDLPHLSLSEMAAYRKIHYPDTEA